MPKKRIAKHLPDLPDEILPMPNSDKQNHEHWYRGRNALDIPAPYRLILAGKPNCGKTCVIKNIIIRACPEFDKIVLLHCDGGEEYADIGNLEILDEIPNPDEWNPKGEKLLCIIDDMDVTNLSKEQHANLDRLFGYVSTHKFVSIILATQNFTNIPVCARRCASMFVVWKSPDKDLIGQIGRKTGLPTKEIQQIMQTYLKSPTDSLWIDLTKGSPYPLRINGYKMLKHRE